MGATAGPVEAVASRKGMRFLGPADDVSSYRQPSGRYGLAARPH